MAAFRAHAEEEHQRQRGGCEHVDGDAREAQGQHVCATAFSQVLSDGRRGPEAPGDALHEEYLAERGDWKRGCGDDKAVLRSVPVESGGQGSTSEIAPILGRERVYVYIVHASVFTTRRVADGQPSIPRYESAERQADDGDVCHLNAGTRVYTRPLLLRQHPPRAQEAWVPTERGAL